MLYKTEPSGWIRMYTFGVMMTWKCPSFSLAKNKSGIQTLAESVKVRYLILPVPQNITIFHISAGSFLQILFLTGKKGKLSKVCKQYRSSVNFWPTVYPSGGQERVTLVQQYRQQMVGQNKTNDWLCHLMYREKARSPAALSTPVKN